MTRSDAALRLLSASGWSSAVALAAVTVCLSTRAVAAEPDDSDRYSLHAEAHSYLRLFQRSLLPGAGGARVSTQTWVPLHQYVTVRALDLDTAWSRDSVDVELSAWGSAAVLFVDRRPDADAERLLDGDVTIANVRHRVGPAHVRIGRQIVVAGVSRFSQLDDISAGARTDFGLGIDGYGGMTVLPRWAEQPGYYHLGSAADSLLRRPDALPEPSRTQNLMFGSRLFYEHPRYGGLGASVHHQSEGGELGRRDVGLDAALSAIDDVSLLVDGFLDTDSGGLVEARALLDTRPVDRVDLNFGYRRAEPALLLSRQSVLSVFSTDRFDEVGGELGFRATSRWRMGGGGFVQVFGGEDLGTRLSLSTRIVPDDAKRVALQFALGRVAERENGYWSGRASLRFQLLEPAAVTAEQYTYVYDTAIRGIGTSTVEALSADYAVTPALKLLLGTSLTRSPYAAWDAQTVVRASYVFDGVPGGGGS